MISRKFSYLAGFVDVLGRDDVADDAEPDRHRRPRQRRRQLQPDRHGRQAGRVDVEDVGADRADEDRDQGQLAQPGRQQPGHLARIGSGVEGALRPSDDRR